MRPKGLVDIQRCETEERLGQLPDRKLIRLLTPADVSTIAIIT